MSILETIRKELNPKPQKTVNMGFRSVTMSASDVPTVIEKQNIDYVWYGDNNLYPYQLQDLRYGSAIHNSILKTKTKMMAGDGLLYNGTKTIEESDAFYKTLQGTQKAELDYLLKNEIGGHTIKELQTLLSDNYQEIGSYAYSILFNKDFTKIAGIKFYKSDNIRCGKMNSEGKITTYYYSRDWNKFKQTGFKPVPIKAYYKDNRDSYEQMVYRKSGNLDYYGIAPYSGALNWIHTDFQMGIFHRANIENGMNPGLHFKFYKMPEPEAEQAILDNIKKQWQGAMRAGKMIATFSEGKDLAMDIAPVETSNLDKQLLLLAELCDKKILTGHQLTTPLLAGVALGSGFSSNSDELETGFQLLDGLTIEADRSLLNDDIQFWFNYNKVGIEVEINKFKPFKLLPTAQPKFTITNG
jgi:hypothetical protein